MKKLIYFALSLFLFVACLNQKEEIIEKKATKIDSVVTTKVEESLVESDTDCVFDNKPKELTTEWLKEVGIENFTWNEKDNKAVVVQNSDTLFIFKGGCNHLSRSVEFKIENNKDVFDATILKQISNLACKFKFDLYCAKIGNDNFEKREAGKNALVLEFEDDDPDDNLIYDGIELKQQGKMLYVTISEYYN